MKYVCPFEKYVGKEVLVKYEGKQFQGNVIDTYPSLEKGNEGIIIEDNKGNIKHIKQRRLDEEPKVV